MDQKPGWIGAAPPEPAVRPGDELYCVVRQTNLEVGSFTSGGEIRWPIAKGTHTGCIKGPLIITPELASALATESSLAICAYIGIDRSCVSRYRRRLDVVRFTPGTIDVWRKLADSKLPREARVRGARTSRIRSQEIRCS